MLIILRSQQMTVCPIWIIAKTRQIAERAGALQSGHRRHCPEGQNGVCRDCFVLDSQLLAYPWNLESVAACTGSGCSRPAEVDRLAALKRGYSVDRPPAEHCNGYSALVKEALVLAERECISMFRPQPAAVKVGVPGPQAPKGSRT
jgi:hypothetical protein